MNKHKDFAAMVESFFTEYLVKERGASHHTIRSYRDSFVQFIEYMAEQMKIKPDKILLSHIDKSRMTSFLNWLENERGASVSTRNQRRAAFKDEGDYLILETFNELNHNWASPTSGELKIQNEWNQVAVDAIRAVGGANATRWIAVPSYQANPGQAMSSAFKIPNDAANKLIVAIHCYDPYSFTLEKESNKDDADLKVKKWGHNAGNSYDEKNITDLFAKIKVAFIDKNIPVYLGEFGCSRHKTDLGNRCRDYYLEYFCRACCFYGLACCIWDNQNPGGGSEHHAYFNHADGSWCDNHEAIVKTMVKAATSNDATYTLESIYARAPK